MLATFRPMLQLSSRLARLAVAPPLARPPAASLHLGSPLLFQMTGEDRDLGHWDSSITS